MSSRVEYKQFALIILTLLLAGTHAHHASHIPHSPSILHIHTTKRLTPILHRTHPAHPSMDKDTKKGFFNPGSNAD
jgi:hypothetical protein